MAARGAKKSKTSSRKPKTSRSSGKKSSTRKAARKPAKAKKATARKSAAAKASARRTTSRSATKKVATTRRAPVAKPAPAGTGELVHTRMLGVAKRLLGPTTTAQGESASGGISHTNPARSLILKRLIG